MKNKKLLLIIFITVILLLNLGITYFSNAETEDIQRILLNNEKITVNDKELLEDEINGIRLTKSTDNEGTSDEAKSANIEIKNVINIEESGTYEFSGELSDGQIAINSNKVKGNVTILLNNANITCENAPAIFVYNKENKSDSCTVTIELADGSNNTISGGKIKQSVERWSDQADLAYYVEKGYDDDKNYYERYKYDGAISSDISLTFEGKGTLNVNGLAKEGIESKRDITFNDGTYIVYSLDDGINACTDRESVITINEGSVLVDVKEEADEGDGIDSNGSIYINGGKVFAFACEKSQDSGLDADTGIYINGGYVVGTGNMADAISTESKQTYMYMQFNNKVQKDTLITILEEDKTPVIAFNGDKSYSVLAISTPSLKNGEHYVYEGGSIEGIKENGLYTEITSYEEGTLKEYNNATNRIDFKDFKKFDNQTEEEKQNSNTYIYILIGLGIALLILIIIAIILIAKKKITLKGSFLMMLIGVIIGVMATIGTYEIIEKKETDEKANEQNQMNNQDRPELPTDQQQQPQKGNPDGEAGQEPMEKPNGGQGEEPPQKPNGEQRQQPQST